MFVLQERGKTTELQLFPGYGRWPLDIQKELKKRGAPTREMVDAIVTELDKGLEEPILAFEFCGALPAGNNAWQRCGRALNAAYPRIPYFYFAELGGVELGHDRRIKAGRLPNPVIPFAYLALGDALSTIALPVFRPSPSIQVAARTTFDCAFGFEDAIVLVRSILAHGFNGGEEHVLRDKAIRAAGALAGMRRQKNTLSADEWEELAKQTAGKSKANWLVKRAMGWRKTVNIPVSATFRDLLNSVQKMAVAIGTPELPICLLSEGKRAEFGQLLRRLYADRISQDFTTWILSSRKPLALVWIAGFKPRGDDSRPDRGLVPLTRMIFGEADVDALSIVYGPGNNLEKVIANPKLAAETNGLWEAILRFSNGVIIDSLKATHLKPMSVLVPAQVHSKPTKPGLIPAGAENPLQFGENDVDSVIHLIFAHALCTSCFECMCNPPGGDWSGLSFWVNGSVLRWTSLPRVTAEGTKRPDHVIQFASRKSILAIESKDQSAAVEVGIGPRLIKYVSSMFGYAHNIVRSEGERAWKPAVNPARIDTQKLISASAFQYRSEGELQEVERRAACDLILGVQFIVNSGKTIVHIKANRQLNWVIDLLNVAANNLSGRLVVQIH